MFTQTRLHLKLQLIRTHFKRCKNLVSDSNHKNCSVLTWVCKIAQESEDETNGRTGAKMEAAGVATTDGPCNDRDCVA